MTFWILDGHKIVKVDVTTWARWFETADRRVANDHVDGKHVSTVFIGSDHRFGDDGPPLIFETMIFGPTGKEDYCDRYSSWEEAEAGHARAVAVIEAP